MRVCSVFIIRLNAVFLHEHLTWYCTAGCIKFVNAMNANSAVGQ